MTFFKKACGRASPCGEGGNGHEESTGQLHTNLDGEVIEEIRDFLEWGGGRLFGDHQIRGCEFGGRGLDSRSCFLLFLPSGRISGCRRLWLGLLRPSIPLLRFLTSGLIQRTSGSVKMWNLAPSPFKGRQCADHGGVGRDHHQILSIQRGRQTSRASSRNQARKARVSRTPEIRMDVLLGRCPAGKQVLATCVLIVVPSGMALRGSYMSLDMRLLTVSEETAGSDGSEPMAVGLNDPLA